MENYLPKKDYSLEKFEAAHRRFMWRMFLNGNVKRLLKKPKMIRFKRDEWLPEARIVAADFIQEKYVS